jgi:hypothetical protein
MKEKHCADLLVGYAIDVLDGTDRTAAERHVLNCPQCRAECVQIQEMLHLCLGQDVPLARPSPLVRTQFLAQLALEMSPTQAESVPGQPARPQAPLITLHEPPVTGTAATKRVPAFAANQRYRWALGGATVPAVLALVLGMLFMHSQNQLDDTRQHLMAEALSLPHVTMPMSVSGVAASHGMHGEVIMPASGMSGMVIVSGITSVPAGKSFTCWVRRQGRWSESGVLRPNPSGIAMMTFGKDVDLHRADDVAVTMERTPHPQTPSGPMLLSSTL